MKITAIGIKFEEKMKVEYENGKFLFNGKEDRWFSKELQYMIDNPPTGYYVTVDEVGIVSKILRNDFFDEPTTDIDIIGYDDPYEFDPNVVY